MLTLSLIPTGRWKARLRVLDEAGRAVHEREAELHVTAGARAVLERTQD